MSGVDLAVRGDPGACRAAADRLDRLARELDTTGRGLTRGAERSEGAWTGSAAASFRASAAGSAEDASALESGVRRLGSALGAFSSDLSEVRHQMASAREAAVAGGLTVTGDMVLAPARDDVPNPDNEQRARAYDDVLRVVSAGRAQERAAHRRLRDGMASEVDGQDWSSLARLGGGASLSYARAFSRLGAQRSAEAFRLGQGATALMRTADNPAASPRMRELARTVAIRQDILSRHNARGAERLRMLKTLGISTFVDADIKWAATESRLPESLTALRRTSSHLNRAALMVDDALGRVGQVPVLKQVGPVAKGIPLAGLPFSALAVKSDMSRGMGAGEAVAKTATATVAGGVATSMATTALAASLAGGPATVAAVAVGIGVSVGVSWAWDHHEEIGEALGDAAGATIDAAQSAGDAIGDAAGAVGDVVSSVVPDVDLTPW